MSNSNLRSSRWMEASCPPLTLTSLSDAVEERDDCVWSGHKRWSPTGSWSRVYPIPNISPLFQFADQYLLTMQRNRQGSLFRRRPARRHAHHQCASKVDVPGDE
jgi:hypothetical protein